MNFCLHLSALWWLISHELEHRKFTTNSMCLNVHVRLCIYEWESTHISSNRWMFEKNVAVRIWTHSLLFWYHIHSGALKLIKSYRGMIRTHTVLMTALDTCRCRWATHLGSVFTGLYVCVCALCKHTNNTAIVRWCWKRSFLSLLIGTHSVLHKWK